MSHITSEPELGSLFVCHANNIPCWFKLQQNNNFHYTTHSRHNEVVIRRVGDVNEATSAVCGL